MELIVPLLVSLVEQVQLLLSFSQSRHQRVLVNNYLQVLLNLVFNLLNPLSLLPDLLGVLEVFLHLHLGCNTVGVAQSSSTSLYVSLSRGSLPFRDCLLELLLHTCLL